MTKKARFAALVLAALLCPQGASAEDYKVTRGGVATPSSKVVLLVEKPAPRHGVVLFQTTLRVNTDGSPLSYHPKDPRGKTKALNNVCNAIAVRRAGSSSNLCLSRFGEAIGVFEQWRDARYRSVPEGYRITWENVLPATKVRGKRVPCVFAAGPYAGYFGSMTALKNGLAGNKGECGSADQVDPMTVPALVLVGGRNAVKDFGAQVGDLLVAYNPATKIAVPAIVGDTGPTDNLGEGSVRLNMALLGKTAPPTNKAETYALGIENTKILVAILPASRSFEIDSNRPYTAANIAQRVAHWQTQSGFASPEDFVVRMQAFQGRLN